MMSRRATDFAMYILIGLGFAFGLICIMKYTTWTGEQVGKWGAFGGNTALIFGIVIKQEWRHRRSRTLWLVILTALALHIPLFAWIMLRFEHFPYSWWIAIDLIEMAALTVLLTALISRA